MGAYSDNKQALQVKAGSNSG